MRLGDKMRWSERALLQRYGMGLMPNQTDDDPRPVLEASPYYFAGMVDAADDLERLIRYIPDVKCAPLPLSAPLRAAHCARGDARSRAAGKGSGAGSVFC